MQILILCCIVAAVAGSDMYHHAYEAPAYPPPAYSPPQPLHLPTGYVVAPPAPIQLHAPKPTTTTFLIHNAEAPPTKPTASVPVVMGPPSMPSGGAYGQ